MAKKMVKEREGFVLIIVLLGLGIISIFGIAIIGRTTSNVKMTKVDSQSQGTYYIAEAGVNQTLYDIGKKVDELSNQSLSHDEFFVRLEQYMDPNIEGSLKDTLEDFGENLGKFPLAKINIGDGTMIKDETIGNYSERVINYIINSKGEIGELSRTVEASINITHKIEKSVSHDPAFDYALYSGGKGTFGHPGGAVVNGSIYGYDLKFEASNTDIIGNIISEKSVDLISAIKVKGNVYAMDGTVKLSSSNIEMQGDIHATDNVTLSSETTVKGSIYTKKDVILESSNGEVTGAIHSGGKVKLGHNANVRNIYTVGDVELGSSTTVNGDINTTGKVAFMSSTTVNGDINATGRLTFGSGNTINGDINTVGNVGDNDNGGNVIVNGNIISGGNVITRASQAYKFLGNVQAAGDIRNGINNEISGDAISSKNVINNGTIKGKIIKNAVPVAPRSPLSATPPEFQQYKIEDSAVPLTEFDIGDKDIVANDNSTQHNIVPGNYKNLTLKWNDTVKFTSGSYYFNEIKGNESAIKLKLDLSNGPINIYSAKDIKFGSGLEVSVSEDGVNYKKIKDIFTQDPGLGIKLAGKVYWEAHKNFQLPENCYFLGSLLANNDFITSSNVNLIGAYAVNEGKITMDYGPTILYAPPSGSAAGGSGSVGEDSDKGQNIIQQEARVKIEKPIREQ